MRRRGVGTPRGVPASSVRASVHLADGSRKRLVHSVRAPSRNGGGDLAISLVDDARISTFDRLGENARALAILERRLGV
jgi:hypothetical protein